ncbi:FHA domain-containing protein [Pseudoduganella ginsengisoli]|uniref:FHA domain-containing protein n=1 Tax=Pseudoduganella ginsengisoli TaxID=1462440 RepID=A0A6L6Q9A5_9BURK|nr:FHA domain-containing protein [Pseudoduganella ginsengisoli]MTW06230.1 FHA domain-containing protein [Pseudoduganella ginsengisoli]
MNKCSNPDHPHCTYWVLPGESACAGGHPQPVSAAPTSYELLSALRARGPATAHGHVQAMQATPLAVAAPPDLMPGLMAKPPSRPQLHISGFDPRAAGGRQTLKMDLRGMPADCAPHLDIEVRSELIQNAGASRQQFSRAADGGWRPVFVEFSSRGKEHGQYQISVTLTSVAEGLPPRRWESVFVILAPRADATLTEIHRIFLSTHKNVRVMADDASIARVQAQGGDSLDIDVTARNAGIAHVNLDAPQGKVDMGFSTIAWDEDLIEIAVPRMAPAHPHPAAMASIVNAAPDAGAQRHIRLFALDECVLGRFELVDPEADVLLTHYSEDGQQPNGLTRRVSGRHAVIRRAAQGGFEIEDVSRYGVLLDGVWPGKHTPVRLRQGMRIELTASIKGVVTLEVSAIMPHGVILHRADHGRHAECFYLLMPDTHPGYPMPPFIATPQAGALPLIVHHNGGFWHMDQLSGKETALAPSTTLDKLSRIPRHTRFAAEPYPESWIIRTGANDLHSTVAASDMTAA